MWQQHSRSHFFTDFFGTSGLFSFRRIGARDHPARGVRLRRVSRPATGCDRPHHRRRRRAGADAHGRRQVAVLPGPGHCPPARGAGRDAGDFAPDRADARPGGRAARGGRGRGFPQFHTRLGANAGHRAAPARRPADAAVRRAGARGHAALSGPAGHAARARRLEPVRHRRSTLREPVGPRFPARIPSADGAARALAERAAHRPHGHRRRGHARRHRRAAAAAKRRAIRQQLRPAQHPLHHRREEGRHAPAAAVHPARARGRGRHRLLPVAPPRGRAGADAVRSRHRRHALPRRSARARAAAEPGPLLARRGRGDVRDDCLRHGHRQARRALCRACGHAQEHRRLLPGDRPRRPRRPAGRRLDDLRPARRGQPAPHDRRKPGRRRLQAGHGGQARCAAGAGRSHRLPPRAAAGLLWRGDGSA